MIDAVVIADWTLDGKLRAAGSPIALTDDEFADLSAKGFVRAASAAAPAAGPAERPVGWVGRVKAAPLIVGDGGPEAFVPSAPVTESPRKGRKPRA